MEQRITIRRPDCLHDHPIIQQQIGPQLHGGGPIARWKVRRHGPDRSLDLAHALVKARCRLVGPAVPLALVEEYLPNLERPSRDLGSFACPLQGFVHVGGFNDQKASDVLLGL